MLRGMISNEVASYVAIDFDSLVKPPEPGWLHNLYLKLNRWPRVQHKIDALYLPWHLRQYRMTSEAATCGWWIANHGFNIKVIIRRPYAAGISRSVEKVLGDFPYDAGHLVVSPDLQHQAMDVLQHCRADRVLRFFTRDKDLARWLPTSLVHVVDLWDESCLRS